MSLPSVSRGIVKSRSVVTAIFTGTFGDIYTFSFGLSALFNSALSRSESVEVSEDSIAGVRAVPEETLLGDMSDIKLSLTSVW